MPIATTVWLVFAVGAIYMLINAIVRMHRLFTLPKMPDNPDVDLTKAIEHTEPSRREEMEGIFRMLDEAGVGFFKKECSSCGRVVAMSTKVCPQCGHLFKFADS